MHVIIKLYKLMHVSVGDSHRACKSDPVEVDILVKYVGLLYYSSIYILFLAPQALMTCKFPHILWMEDI
jgi:hypothetical protein